MPQGRARADIISHSHVHSLAGALLHPTWKFCRSRGEPLLPCTFFWGQWTTGSLFCSNKWQKHRRASPTAQTRSQPLPVLGLLISQWPGPVTWLNSRPRGLVHSTSQEITAAVWIHCSIVGCRIGTQNPIKHTFTPPPPTHTHHAEVSNLLLKHQEWG